MSKAVLPQGKRFAFTVLDDTDNGNVQNLRPIYDLFTELGMRTTKTLWPLDCEPERRGIFEGSQTLEDSEYADFIFSLLERGFEIASHGATMVSSPRERTLRGIAILEETFGSAPTIHCNHSQNQENLYWGPKRYRNRAIRWLASLFHFAGNGTRFEGEDPASPHYWGDVCEQKFKYVRNFTFHRLDTAHLPPGRPYHDPSTPGVRYWFTTSDAADARTFRRLVTRRRIDRLVRKGGVCILSTHLAADFVVDGKVDPVVEERLRYIASFDGWFVPTSEILDHLLATVDGDGITGTQRVRLELSHVIDRISRLIAG